jgi:hypothetical protein
VCSWFSGSLVVNAPDPLAISDDAGQPCRRSARRSRPGHAGDSPTAVTARCVTPRTQSRHPPPIRNRLARLCFPSVPHGSRSISRGFHGRMEDRPRAVGASQAGHATGVTTQPPQPGLFMRYGSTYVYVLSSLALDRCATLCLPHSRRADYALCSPASFGPNNRPDRRAR